MIDASAYCFPMVDPVTYEKNLYPAVQELQVDQCDPNDSDDGALDDLLVGRKHAAWR